MKRIFLVRHCNAAGQQPDAPLTDEGLRQAKELAERLQAFEVEYLISSPYKRAIESIRPLTEITGIKITIDERLRERILSSTQMDDWMDCLEKTYVDFDLKFEGGESTREATFRGVQVIQVMEGCCPS